MLSALAETQNDELIKAVCTPTQNKSKAAFPPFDPSKLLLQNAHNFPGMTLTVSGDPMDQIGSTADLLVKEFPSLKKLTKEIEVNKNSRNHSGSLSSRHGSWHR